MSDRGEDQTEPPREVKLSFFVRTIDEIDLPKQRFRVNFNFIASWTETYYTKDEWERKDEKGNRVTKLPWDPQLMFLNRHENLLQEPDIWYRYKMLEKGEKDEKPSDGYVNLKELKNGTKVLVMRCENCHGWFNEKFELEKFPFDHQLLHIGLTSTWDNKEVVLKFDHHRGSRVSDTFMLQSYELHSPRLLADSEKLDKGKIALQLKSNREDSVSGAVYSRAYLALSVARKPNSVCWNVMFIIFLLGLASLFTFTIDKGDIGDRHSSILTLLLTVVAFKYVTVSTLPDIPYMTYMDGYTLLCLIHQMVIYILVSVSDFSGELKWYETWQFRVSAAIWGLMTLFSLQVAMNALCRRRKELVEWDEHYKDLKVKWDGKKTDKENKKDILPRTETESISTESQADISTSLCCDQV